MACKHNIDSTNAPPGRERAATLKAVLTINACMFLIVFAAGLWADSSALLADSADNLGDAFVYAISLYVAYRSLRWRAGAAFIKGLVQLAFGLAIIIGIVIKLLGQPEPAGLAIMAVAAAALVANLVCLLLLQRHRGEDVNMRSVWLCSRNDVIGNLAVIVSGAAVWLTGNFWPDLIVAALLATVFLHTSYEVLRDATHTWHASADSDRGSIALDNLWSTATYSRLCGGAMLRYLFCSSSVNERASDQSFTGFSRSRLEHGARVKQGHFSVRANASLPSWIRRFTCHPERFTFPISVITLLRTTSPVVWLTHTPQMYMVPLAWPDHSPCAPQRS